jgi:hypothetical protein
MKFFIGSSFPRATLNNIADKGFPCLTPVLTAKYFEKSLTVFTLVTVFVGVILISHIGFNGISLSFELSYIVLPFTPVFLRLGSMVL